MELNEKDRELIEIATELIKSNKDIYEDLNLLVGSALRAKSGKVYKGINLSTSHSVCAEQVAIGQAFAGGERELDVVVSVKLDKTGKIRVVSPCGLCRYIFDELASGINVIVENSKSGDLAKVKSSELLPYPYRRGES